MISEDEHVAKADSETCSGPIKMLTITYSSFTFCHVVMKNVFSH